MRRQWLVQLPLQAQLLVDVDLMSIYYGTLLTIVPETAAQYNVVIQRHLFPILDALLSIQQVVQGLAVRKVSPSGQVKLHALIPIGAH